MNTELKQLQIKLKEKGIKPTYIRLKILHYLQNNQKHPDAEQIFRAIKIEVPTVSLTTIYNTLDLFQEKKLIKPLLITGSKVRYDMNETPHSHFYCQECGMIIDLDVEYGYLNRENLKGHKVIETHGYFIGLCKNCLKKTKKRGEKNEYV